jgi:hypothetical protein
MPYENIAAIKKKKETSTKITDVAELLKLAKDEGIQVAAVKAPKGWRIIKKADGSFGIERA